MDQFTAASKLSFDQPNKILNHGPVFSSWISVVRRQIKALRPSIFSSFRRFSALPLASLFALLIWLIDIGLRQGHRLGYKQVLRHKDRT
jgi:hypothetical protein